MKWKYATSYKRVSIIFVILTTNNIYYFKLCLKLTIRKKLNFIFEKAPDELCIGKILHGLDTEERTCECGAECEEKSYEVKTSSSLWPSREYEVYKSSM